MILRQNSTGEDVSRLQLALKIKGFDPGTVDGVFGPATERAVREFQAQTGLMVDGIAGPQTLAALFPDQVTIPSRASWDHRGRDPKERLLELWPTFQVVAQERPPHDPHLLAALAWKETVMGTTKLLDNDYRGDNGHGHGLMQIDDRTWGKLFAPNFPKWWHSDAWSIVTGAMILEQNLNYFERKVTAGNIGPEEKKWLAVTAYNCGIGRVRIPVCTMAEPERFLEIAGYYTTGRNYPLDVWNHYRMIREVV